MKIVGEILSQLVMACSVSGLPADLVEAIVMTESSGYVYALSGSYDYSDYFLLPAIQSEADYAMSVGQASLEHNVNVSVGLMQINSWHIDKMGASIATVIDPCNNVLIGTSILREIIDRVCPSTLNNDCINAALRQYNTGKTKETAAGNAYVAKVRSRMAQIAQSQPVLYGSR